MKNLLKLAKTVNSMLVVITIGGKVGYIIIDSDFNELVSIEACTYSDGSKWLVKNRCKSTISYYKSLSSINKEVISKGFTGYKFKP